MERIISLPNTGVNMAATADSLFVRCGRNIHRFSLNDMRETACTQLFAKDGRARDLLFCNHTLYARDFIMLYALHGGTLETLQAWKLGEDLSSDICAFCGDDKMLYAATRGGGIAAIDVASGEMTRHSITDTSIWSLALYGKMLFAACVGGELLAINPADMRIVRRKQIHRKNIYSIVVKDGILYTTSQDGSLLATSALDLGEVCRAKKAITNMTPAIGVYEDIIVTANPNRNELTLRNRHSLTAVRVVPFPTGGLGSNSVVMQGGAIFGSDREGIYRLEISHHI